MRSESPLHNLFIYVTPPYGYAGGGNGFRYDASLRGYLASFWRILVKSLCGCGMGPVVREDGLIGVHEAGTRT